MCVGDGSFGGPPERFHREVLHALHGHRSQYRGDPLLHTAGHHASVGSHADQRGHVHGDFRALGLGFGPDLGTSDNFRPWRIHVHQLLPATTFGRSRRLAGRTDRGAIGVGPIGALRDPGVRGGHYHDHHHGPDVVREPPCWREGAGAKVGVAYRPSWAYLRSVAALVSRHQASFFTYQSTVALSPSRKLV